MDAIVALDHVARQDHKRVAYIAEAIRSRKAFVAECDGKVVGYGVISYSFYENGMIELIYVDQDYRRLGIGRSLVEHAEACCQTPKLFTSTNLSNKPMQLLLEGMGYRLSGYIDNLDPGDPELVYFKYLVDKTLETNV
ncbi:MAG: GNAT family N-acetyltransferase [Firmicutes bacterium]|nr:GNAT family N-acetyltransferase [Bacillota bacterium]